MGALVRHQTRCRVPLVALVPVVALLVVLTLACGADEPQATNPEATGSETTGSEANAPAVVWEPCGGGAECTTLEVPIDWDQPTTGTLDIAVTRRPATGGPATGVLLVHPGGPGVAANDWLQATSVFDDLNVDHDIVAWNPRGTGDGSRLSCGDGDVPSGTDVHRLGGSGAALGTLVDGCVAGSPALVANLGTTQTIRDIEAIRQALGTEQISFLGFSYGSYVGLAYADAFGDRVAAMVLDGVVDPTLDLEGLLGAQAAGIEELVDRLAADPDGGPNLIDRLLADPDVDPNVVAFAAIAASYAPDYHADLKDALRAGVDGDLWPLEDLADLYWSSVEFTAYLGTLCVDLVVPDDPDAHGQMVERLTGIAPRLGAAIGNEVAGCALWPQPDGSAPPGPATSGNAPPVLLVGATGDLATPASWARAVHRRLDNSALLIHESNRHTSYGSSRCVNDAVEAHLRDPGATTGTSTAPLTCPASR